MYCPHCGNQTANESRSCSACARAIERRSRIIHRGIVRPHSPRMLAGVCSGAAIHFGWDITFTRRMMAVAVCLTTGVAIVPYLVAWAVLPNASYAMGPGVRA